MDIQNKRLDNDQFYNQRKEVLEEDGAATAIEGVETEVENTIYDLTGRKIETITKGGIYIVNGKKVLVK